MLAKCLHDWCTFFRAGQCFTLYEFMRKTSKQKSPQSHNSFWKWYKSNLTKFASHLCPSSLRMPSAASFFFDRSNVVSFPCYGPTLFFFPYYFLFCIKGDSSILVSPYDPPWAIYLYCRNQHGSRTAASKLLSPFSVHVASKLLTHKTK